MSTSVMLKVSLTEMGRPWRGPIGLEVFWRWASSFAARERARRNKGSVRQFVSWWVREARRMKAFVTVVAVRDWEWIFERSWGRGRSVIWLSRGVRRVVGIWWTGWGPLEGWGGSFGRRDGGTVIEIEGGLCRAFCRSWSLRWEMDCHVGVGVGSVIVDGGFVDDRSCESGCYSVGYSL